MSCKDISLFDKNKLLSYTYSQVLAANHGVLIHAAAVLKDKKALLFLGPSGGGKSTVAALSGDHDVIADDIVAIRKRSGDFYAYSTPWRQSGVVRTDKNAKGKVSAIFFIRKSHRIKFRPIKPEEALARMITRQIHFLTYTRMPLAGKIFHTACDFASSVPAYEMEFRKDTDFWQKLETSINAAR